VGSLTATSETALARGSGYNFSTAAVMMPSDPSEPTNSCLTT